MSSNVEQREAEAIRELLEEGAAGDARVTERDFRHPRRLSRAALADFTRVVSGAVNEIEARVAKATNAHWPLELAAVREASASGLFDGQQGPFAALRFECSGQIGWITWDDAAAVAGVETVLGGESEGGEARVLSRIEALVLQTILAPIADVTLRALGVEAGAASIAQTHEALGDWLDAGDDADPYRVHVAYVVEGPGARSTIDVYVPMPRTIARSRAAARGRVALPDHLDRVEIALAVRMEGCEVALDDLLALEVGDVIPLDARVGDLATLCVDDRPVGRGQLGTRDTKLALRIEHLEQESEDQA